MRFSELITMASQTNRNPTLPLRYNTLVFYIDSAVYTLLQQAILQIKYLYT